MAVNRWRNYRTPNGFDPVTQFLSTLPPADRRVVQARMRVALEEPRSTRHLRGELYEVRASRGGRAYRVPFMREGRHSQVFVALDAFEKRSARTPLHRLRLAEQRAREWRARGRDLGRPSKVRLPLGRGALGRSR